MAKVALITGAARRVGAAIAARLHQAGFNLVIHYRDSDADARQLIARLNEARSGSAIAVQAALERQDAAALLIKSAAHEWGRLDVLVNNASRYRATPVGTITEADWQDLIAVNLRAPLFLAQAAAPELARNGGSIINIADVYGERPQAGYPVYSITKAGIVMLTRSLAVELAPAVRVNAVAPGAVLWPEQATPAHQARVLERTALHRAGHADDVAQAVGFLVEANYITGQILAVDGGRLLTI